MPRIVNGETYLNTKETIAEFGSRTRFYINAKPYIKKYQFDAKKAPWYKEADVHAIRDGKVVQRGHVIISGIYGNWTESLRSQGYRAETQVTEINIVPLPSEAIDDFHLAEGGQYLKRSRITFADSVPICTWSTYYPLPFVENDVEAIKQGVIDDIVLRMKERSGIIVSRAIDKYAARMTTMEERNLFRTSIDEPVLILQRASYTDNGKTLALYSNMVLLASWFAPEYEYEVHNWDDKKPA